MTHEQHDFAEERERLLEHYADINITQSVTTRSPTPVAGGGFADIYVVHGSDCESGEMLALKFIRVSNIPRMADKLKVLRKLRQELSVWAKAVHPNIHRLLGIAWEPRWTFPALVSTWEANGNMTEYLDAITPGTAVENLYVIKLGLLEGVLNGLAYLHDQEVIHADVKPANVLVASNGKALLCDFGVSWTATKRSISFTHDRLSKGTPSYMAPEFFPAAEPENVVDNDLYTKASDVWAFGCLLFEIMHGSSPWAGRTYYQIARSLSRGARFRCPDTMDPRLRALVTTCCAISPMERPSVVDIARHVQKLYPDASEVTQSGSGSCSSSQPVPPFRLPDVPTPSDETGVRVERD